MCSNAFLEINDNSELVRDRTSCLFPFQIWVFFDWATINIQKYWQLAYLYHKFMPNCSTSRVTQRTFLIIHAVWNTRFTVKMTRETTKFQPLTWLDWPYIAGINVNVPVTLSAAITFSKGRNGTVSNSERSLPELFNEETIKWEPYKHFYRPQSFNLSPQLSCSL